MAQGQTDSQFKRPKTDKQVQTLQELIQMLGCMPIVQLRLFNSE